MKNAMMVMMIVVLGCSLALAQEKASVKAQAPVVVGNTVCPVSGQKVETSGMMAPVTVEYKGKVYNLCCGGCVAEFNRDPETYVKKVEEQMKKDMPAGHQM